LADESTVSDIIAILQGVKYMHYIIVLILVILLLSLQVEFGSRWIRNQKTRIAGIANPNCMMFSQFVITRLSNDIEKQICQFEKEYSDFERFGEKKKPLDKAFGTFTMNSIKQILQSRQQNVKYTLQKF
jgi:hypothetical protein